VDGADTAEAGGATGAAQSWSVMIHLPSADSVWVIVVVVCAAAGSPGLRAHSDPICEQPNPGSATGTASAAGRGPQSTVRSVGLSTPPASPSLGWADGDEPPQPETSSTTTPNNQIIRRIRPMLGATQR
jgi:hypothetical protein